MSVFPDNDTIEQISIELNIDSVFLEKDWHVSNVIKALAEFENERFEPIFCGGTRLLKGSIRNLYLILSDMAESPFH